MIPEEEMVMKLLVKFISISLIFIGFFSPALSNSSKTLTSARMTSKVSFSMLFSSPDELMLESISTDSKGNAWLGGYTVASNLPIKGVPLIPSHFPSNEPLPYSHGYLMQFSPEGNLLYSSYFSGNDDTYIMFVAVDSNDNLIVAGYTNSTEFPTVNAFQEKPGGKEEVFILKLSSSLEIKYCTFLGGSEEDSITALSVAIDDRLFMAGTTRSYDFPLTNSLTGNFTRESKSISYIAEIDQNGALVYSSYFGGSHGDSINDLKVNEKGYILLGGYALSWDFPGAEKIPEKGSRSEGFVSLLSSEKELLFSYCFDKPDHGSGNIVKQVLLTPQEEILVLGSGELKNIESIIPLQKTYNFMAHFSLSGNLLSLGQLLSPHLITCSLVDKYGHLILGGTGDNHYDALSFADPYPLYPELHENKGSANLSVYLPDCSGFKAFVFGSGSFDFVYRFSMDKMNNLWILGHTRNLDFPQLNDQRIISCNDCWEDHPFFFLTRIQLPPSLAKPYKLLLQIGQEKATLMEKGKVTELPPLEAPPMIMQGRTLIPVRVLAETMGMNIYWVSAGQYIWLDRDGVRLELQIGRNFAWKYALNTPEKREKLEMDVPPMIVNNRTLLPLRFVAENFGALVDWNGFEQKILVSWE
jgi:hypothetical protein